MLTNGTLIKHFSVLLPLLVALCGVGGVGGATVTWGQVNKYASTLYAQDVYLADATADADADVDANVNLNVADVVYGSQNTTVADGYTITAVHAYDMTPLALHDGDGGTARLLSGGIGQQHATIRFQRHPALPPQLPIVHFQLVIYGVEL